MLQPFCRYLPLNVFLLPPPLKKKSLLFELRDQIIKTSDQHLIKYLCSIYNQLGGNTLVVYRVYKISNFSDERCLCTNMLINRPTACKFSVKLYFKLFVQFVILVIKQHGFLWFYINHIDIVMLSIKYSFNLLTNLKKKEEKLFSIKHKSKTIS